MSEQRDYSWIKSNVTIWFIKYAHTRRGIITGVIATPPDYDHENGYVSVVMDIDQGVCRRLPVKYLRPSAKEAYEAAAEQCIRQSKNLNKQSAVLAEKHAEYLKKARQVL